LIDCVVTEAKEELGLILERSRIHELAGQPGNPNGAYFVTSEPHEGIRFYSYELANYEIEDDNSALCGFSIKKYSGAILDQKENIRTSVFLPWREAVKCGDLFIQPAVSRLLGEMPLSMIGL
jgi:hypothetical protein